MDQFHKALMELNMDSPEELQSYIHKLSSAVEQAKQKILQSEVTLEVDVVDSKPEVLSVLGKGVIVEIVGVWEECLEKADIKGAVTRLGGKRAGVVSDAHRYTGRAVTALTCTNWSSDPRDFTL